MPMTAPHIGGFANEDSPRVSEAVARPARSAAQGGVGWIVTELIDAFVWDMSDRQYGIAVLALGVLFSFIQTTLENRAGKGILRNVPPKTSPLVDDERGAVDLGTALIFVVLVVLVLLLAGVLR